MKKEEERIKDMIGIVFFSVFFAIPVIESTMPMPVRESVIKSPIGLPTYAILVGVTKTMKKQMIPMIKEV